tara:strand:- start:7489 stop:8736 length:1248 start_codon:yes stop_codon:yes gene_type:complete
MTIPNINSHKEYISYLKSIYLENVNSIKQKLPLTTEQKEQAEEISTHYALNFRQIKEIVNEDFFEWNHAICCTLVYCSYLQQMQFDIDEEFIKQYYILPIKKTLADLILLLHHIDKKWKDIELDQYDKWQNYIKCVHSNIAVLFSSTDNLKIYNRWNLIKYLKDNYFTFSTNGLMYCSCRIAYHLRYLLVGKYMKPHLAPTPIIPDIDIENITKWAIEQQTYFSIRKFRMRMIHILWTFFNDEPSRCYYTYTRTGETPTILAHVTASYPSTWISSIQHELLYNKAPELINHSNHYIQDAVLVALFEAHFKTHYNILWTKYCMCMEDDICKVYKNLLTVEHPMILKIWGHFYVFFDTKLYKCKRFQRAMVLWLTILKEKCNSTIFKNINMSNTINRILPPETQPTEEDENIFEVYL